MESKKKKIVLVITIVFLVVLVIGATYAYFVAQTGEGAATDVEVSANTVDTFSFEAGSPLKFTADQFTFTEGGKNASASTFAKAILTANSKTNTVTEHYYLYLNININTFTYSQDSTKPELLLQITDKSGNAVTNVTGLEYKTVTNGAGTQISGFDVTTKNGLITLFDNREITTTSTLEEQWNVTLIFVNYEFNQAANGGNVFNAKILIQKAAAFTNLTDVCKDGENLASCIKTLSEESVSGATHIYYHSSNLPLSAADSSYRYAGSSESVNNFVCFGSTATPCPTDNLYRIIGVIDDKVKLIKYDYMTTEESGTDGDYLQTYKKWGMEYTYKGTYRGGERIGVYYWNYKADTANYNNTWSKSLLNKTNLNTNFINYLGEEWANKIATTTWKVGGNTWSNIALVKPSEAYQNEIVKSTSTIGETEYSAKIGLMYVTDYEFAASLSAWTLIGYLESDSTKDYRAATNNNWMYMGLYDWTISRSADDSDSAFSVDYDGSVGGDYVNDDGGSAVRPVFNLESSVTYVSGSGTQSDPIIIN